IERGINEALTDLPEKCREVFVLSYINGLSSKEIAHAMNISVRTVEAHVYKALRLMRARLKHLVCVLLLLAGIS
ncbi:MAG: sigma-70 family RNA polymerase sigma factor, partial [Muribaculaceae bacterium]|nr:sigma-70 family RNA polymerase sigma factor [Muribaculaceae bacterium]